MRGNNPAKPKLACEIAADRVLVGRLGMDGRSLEACAARELAPGSVVPDLVEGNLRQRDAVREAVQATLSSVAGRSHDVIAVVPDAAVRVVLLEFDTLPSDSEEASGVVRFRMKKSLPFDVEKARVSYHAQKTGEGVRVVAAVALASVIEDYEIAFREGGVQSGSGGAIDAGCAGGGRGATAYAGGEGGCADYEYRDPQCGPVAAFPHTGKHARRDHYRRAVGGGCLSVRCIFSGHLSLEHREDICCGIYPTQAARRLHCARKPEPTCRNW